jgi:hypothetical protein
MNKKNVLVVSNKLSERNSLSKWTNVVHPFHLNIAHNDEATIELCHIEQFDIVVVDGTDHTIDSKKLHAVLPILQEEITMLRYEGESAEELDSNIKAIFNAKKYKRIQEMLMLEPSVGSFSNLPSFSLN